jgi:hypothetical protein
MTAPLIWLLWAVFFFTGCATLAPDRRQPRYDPATTAAILAVQQPDPRISTLKGIGTFRLVGLERNMSGRIAWAVQLPDRLRIALLDITGKPLTVMATDGRWFYVDARHEGRFYKKRVRSLSFEKMIGIDISVEALIVVLAGGVPLQPHHTARLVSNSETDRCRIDLFEQDDYLVQQIWCRNNNTQYTAEGFTVNASNGGIRYHVELSGSRNAEETTFFKTVIISDHQNRFRLTVDRIWAPAVVEDTLFTLHPR